MVFKIKINHSMNYQRKSNINFFVDVIIIAFIENTNFQCFIENYLIENLSSKFGAIITRFGRYNFYYIIFVQIATNKKNKNDELHFTFVWYSLHDSGQSLIRI